VTSVQVPVGSGFGILTTAAEVLAGVDLTGRLALVTGGYSGIGLEVVRALAGAGATVLAPARRPEVAEEALAGIGQTGAGGVQVDRLDLADQASVASYAEKVLGAGRHVDILIGNAGVMACPEARTPREGWELQLATNHLGHFALVNRVWPLLTGGSRVVSVSSSGHHLSDVRWDDPGFTTGYDKWQAYGQSKTANVLFAVHLDARGRAEGVRAFSLHPGAILTPLGRHLQPEDMADLLSYGEDGQLVLPDFKSAEAGAATAVWAATSPLLEDRGGAYLEDCEVAPVADPSPAVVSTSGVKAYATDPVAAERLWAWSAEQTGLDALSS
jgi:NAD(P)-dependent dehydrogenase (short-subunit alcohol dehydrogenase family)